MRSARPRAERIAPAAGAFRESRRNEIPRDRSFWNIFLDHVQATQPEREATGRDGHQFQPALQHALHHFHAPSRPARFRVPKIDLGHKDRRWTFQDGAGLWPGKYVPRVSATDGRRAAPARARDARPKGRDPQPMPTATRSAASMAPSAGLLARQGSPVAKRCAQIATKTANDKSALQAEDVVAMIRRNKISVAKLAGAAEGTEAASGARRAREDMGHWLESWARRN